MREIKFRYRYDTGIHIETNKQRFKFEIITLSELEDGRLKEGKILSRDEFTNIKDENGKEIFERDILQMNNVDETKAIVNWIVSGFYFGHIPISEFVNQGYKVIGDVYSNPELLNKK